jgi:rhodanese-related sulfurtransferase
MISPHDGNAGRKDEPEMNRAPSRKGPGALLALLGLVTVAGCAPAAVEQEQAELGQVVPVGSSGSYVDITPGELEAMLEAKDFFFVNVHIPYEGEIPDTDAFIPFDQVGDYLDEFPEDRAAKIVLYCRSGSMSAIASRALVEQGFTQLFNLDGGFRAWQEQGFLFSE